MIGKSSLFGNSTGHRMDELTASDIETLLYVIRLTESETREFSDYIKVNLEDKSSPVNTHFRVWLHNNRVRMKDKEPRGLSVTYLGALGIQSSKLNFTLLGLLRVIGKEKYIFDLRNSDPEISIQAIKLVDRIREITKKRLPIEGAKAGDKNRMADVEYVNGQLYALRTMRNVLNGLSQDQISYIETYWINKPITGKFVN